MLMDIKNDKKEGIFLSKERDLKTIIKNTAKRYGLQYDENQTVATVRDEAGNVKMITFEDMPDILGTPSLSTTVNQYPVKIFRVVYWGSGLQQVSFVVSEDKAKAEQRIRNLFKEYSDFSLNDITECDISEGTILHSEVIEPV